MVHGKTGERTDNIQNIIIMKKYESLSKSRLIMEATLNGQKAKFLVDTGATVGLLSDGIIKKYKLIKGKKFGQPLVGAGGSFKAYYCNTFAYIDGNPITQFLIADIDNVIDSIKRECGIEIQGIISLPQMKQAGIQIDANDNLIIVE